MDVRSRRSIRPLPLCAPLSLSVLQFRNVVNSIVEGVAEQKLKWTNKTFKKLMIEYHGNGSCLKTLQMDLVTRKIFSMKRVRVVVKALF